MCLPFACGGGHGDPGSPDHPGVPHAPPQQPPPPPLHPPVSSQPRYDTASPVKDSYDNRTPRKAAAAGGEARNGGADAAPWHAPGGGNRNGDSMMGFDTTDAGVRAPAAVVRGPAVAAASYPKDSSDRMRPPPVAQMARRGGGAEDSYPAAAVAAAATQSPVANNFYGGHGHGYDGNYAYGWGQR